ncbi:MAG: peptide deformylase [Chitinophagaceae bacterium]|nr:peptide deformylase [Chitinophagaceae bacterium]
MERSAETRQDEEGCLSIPNLSRNRTITIEYFNKDFKKQIKTFGGTTARMIQHEYDHTGNFIP